MITTKSLRIRAVAQTWTAPKPKPIFQLLAIAAAAVALFPSVSSFITHQLRLQAANGRSCLRVTPDRTSQVRKYGADCNL